MARVSVGLTSSFNARLDVIKPLARSHTQTPNRRHNIRKSENNSSAKQIRKSHFKW